MPTPFGPQLIGQTEKALNALLLRILDGRLTEPEWVGLRLSAQLDGTLAGRAALSAALSERNLPAAASVVDRLTSTGLVVDGRPSAAGRDLLARVQAEIAERTAGIWDLPADDVATAQRVLGLVLDRTRAALR